MFANITFRRRSSRHRAIINSQLAEPEGTSRRRDLAPLVGPFCFVWLQPVEAGRHRRARPVGDRHQQRGQAVRSRAASLVRCRRLYSKRLMLGAAFKHSNAAPISYRLLHRDRIRLGRMRDESSERPERRGDEAEQRPARHRYARKVRGTKKCGHAESDAVAACSASRFHSDSNILYRLPRTSPPAIVSWAGNAWNSGFSLSSRVTLDGDVSRYNRRHASVHHRPRASATPLANSRLRQDKAPASNGYQATVACGAGPLSLTVGAAGSGGICVKHFS